MKLSNETSICSYIFQDLIVLKPLVSLISLPVACSARIAVDRETHTHTETKYSKPHCASTPGVNHGGALHIVGSLLVFHIAEDEVNNVNERSIARTEFIYDSVKMEQLYYISIKM